MSSPSVSNGVEEPREAGPPPEATGTPALDLEPESDPSALVELFADWPAERTEAETYPSPNGIFEAVVSLKFGLVHLDREYYYSLVQVFSAQGELLYTPIEQVAPFGLGYTRPEVVSWSKVGPRAYLADRVVVDGCAPFGQYVSLRAVDLETGEVEQVGEGLQGAVSVSPDERYLAAIAWRDNEYRLDLLQLGDGKLTSSALEGLNADDLGAIVWSPHSTAFAFTAAQLPCLPDWQHSVVRVDFPDLTTTIFELPEDEQLITAEWDESGILLNTLADPEPHWRMDPLSGELTPID